MARASFKNVMRLLNDANTDVPVEKSFLNDLKRSIELTTEKNARKPSLTYKPSSMNCARQMVYQVLGKDATDTKANYCSVGIVNSGSDIHERIQGYISRMKENGIDCEYVDVAEFIKSRDIPGIEVKGKSGVETKLYNAKLNMSFMCDGIIRYKGRYYILEIKTETSNKFWQRDRVDSAHHNQAIAYALALGLDDVMFVYISRDTLDLKSYLFNVTKEMKAQLVGLIDYCDSYVKNLSIPPKPLNVDKKTCTYCGYKELCKRDN